MQYHNRKQHCTVFLDSGTTTVLANKDKDAPGPGTAATDWKGEVTAREVAKKARAHRFQTSSTVVQVLQCRIEDETNDDPGEFRFYSLRNIWLHWYFRWHSVRRGAGREHV